MSALTDRIAAELAGALPPAVGEIAAQLAGPGVAAVLFYGSVLRTGDLSGVVDYYVLTNARRPPKVWPLVSYREFVVAGTTVRAKIATLPLATFARAAAGKSRDTTIWARFVQPAALAWVRDDRARAAVVGAVADAVATATRFAAALGPASGPASAFWAALFRATYAAEFRVEAGGREGAILAHDPARYDALLPLGWHRAGLWYDRIDCDYRPHLTAAERRVVLKRWRSRRRWGKPLNVARLVQAAFTFDGAARYAAWKIERHTGVAVPLKPWQERHPILAAPGVLLKVWRKR